MELAKEIEEDKEIRIEYKRLERIRGFLCHLAMVYEELFPYLKGFHLTLAQHLPKRNEEGWKIADLKWIAHVEGKVDSGVFTREQADLILYKGSEEEYSPPRYISLVPRFHQCLKVLVRFLRRIYPLLLR